MSEFTFDLGLPPWLRELAVRHLAQTHHMCYEPSGHPVGECAKPGCAWNSPPAAVLRSLTEAVKAGGPVRLRPGGLGKPERARVSALLEQTAARAARDGQDELSRVFGQLWREWDRVAKVPAGEYERAELVAYNGRRPVPVPAHSGVVEG